jgi:hypothetical protein
MEIKRNGSQPSGKGPAEWFTGNVRIDPLAHAPAPARVSVASVTFMDVADLNIIDQVDAAYRSKYRRYDAQYVDPMLTAEARAAIIKLVPR